MPSRTARPHQPHRPPGRTLAVMQRASPMNTASNGGHCGVIAGEGHGLADPDCRLDRSRASPDTGAANSTCCLRCASVWFGRPSVRCCAWAARHSLINCVSRVARCPSASTHISMPANTTTAPITVTDPTHPVMASVLSTPPPAAADPAARAITTGLPCPPALARGPATPAAGVALVRTPLARTRSAATTPPSRRARPAHPGTLRSNGPDNAPATLEPPAGLDPGPPRSVNGPSSHAR